MEEERAEEYLNSFHLKMVTLWSGKQLYPQVALEQLCVGVIAKEDILCDGDSEESKFIWILIGYIPSQR